MHVMKSWIISQSVLTDLLNLSFHRPSELRMFLFNILSTEAKITKYMAAEEALHIFLVMSESYDKKWSGERTFTG